MGKLFSETIRNVCVESLGRVESAASREARRLRSAARQAAGRGVVRSDGAEFRVKVSGSVKEAEQAAVVCVLRSDWERVTLREEFVGRFRAVERLPQYLEGLNAMTVSE